MLFLILVFYTTESPLVVQVTEITNEVNLMVHVWSPEMSMAVLLVQSLGRLLLNQSTFLELRRQSH